MKKSGLYCGFRLNFIERRQNPFVNSVKCSDVTMKVVPLQKNIPILLVNGVCFTDIPRFTTYIRLF